MIRSNTVIDKNFFIVNFPFLSCLYCFNLPYFHYIISIFIHQLFYFSFMKFSYKTKMQFCISYIQNCISSIIKFITDILPADRSNFHPLTNLLQISQPYGYHRISPRNQILHSCSVLSSSHSQG